MLEGSLRCFTCGLIGLLPLIGFPLALLALMAYRRVCIQQRGHWNAARVYLIWGFVFGGIGLVASLCVLGAILVAAVNGGLF